MDESSDSEGHPENTGTSQLTLISIKEKAALVSTKGLPCQDLSVDGSDELPNTVRRTSE
jgi:hypothetical protein